MTPEAEDPRLALFLEHVPRDHGPDSPWQCGNCSLITAEHDAGRGRVIRRVSHLQTCQACRQAGAPDTLPWP